VKTSLVLFSVISLRIAIKGFEGFGKFIPRNTTRSTLWEIATTPTLSCGSHPIPPGSGSSNS